MGYDPGGGTLYIWVYGDAQLERVSFFNKRHSGKGSVIPHKLAHSRKGSPFTGKAHSRKGYLFLLPKDTTVCKSLNTVSVNLLKQIENVLSKNMSMLEGGLTGLNY